jgi:glutathione S-transferase
MMNEKHLDYQLKTYEFWDRSKQNYKLTKFGSVPILVGGKNIFQHSYLASSYLERVYGNVELIPKDFVKNLQVKTMCLWFEEKFFNDVVYHVLYQKVINFLKDNKSPDTNIINLAKANLSYYFEYIEKILSTSTWIACDFFTLADISAGCQISVLDYLGVIDWKKVPSAITDWYCVVKSRSSFHSILEDRIAGFDPPTHYSMLDF